MDDMYMGTAVLIEWARLSGIPGTCLQIIVTSLQAMFLISTTLVIKSFKYLSILPVTHFSIMEPGETMNQ